MTSLASPSLAVLLLGLPALCAAQSPQAGVSRELGGEAPGNEVHARLDVAQTLGADPATSRYLLFTDLRLVGDASRLGGTALSLRLDGRARKSWNDLAEDRVTPTEAFAKYGDDSTAWRVAVGRQLVRSAASAEVDGVSLERRVGGTSSVLAFAGLQPHPLTEAFGTDFRTAGLAYESRGKTSNSAGGLVLSMFGSGLDRLYLTERGYFSLGRTLLFSGFALVDLVSPRGLFASGTDGQGVDLTNANAMVRWRPARWFDSALSASHVHTILPSKWWRDWFALQQQARGFVVDGDQAVGTRITSLRWTNTFTPAPWAAPYLRLRYDVRHTERATGWEGKAGFKWRPAFGYLDVSYTYRDWFAAQGQLATLRLGLESKLVGFEGGTTLLRSRRHGDGAITQSWDLDALAWVDIGTTGVRVMAQYQAFLDPGSTFHTVFTEIGYRF